MFLILLSVVTLKAPDNDTVFLFNRNEVEIVAYRLDSLCNYKIALTKYQSLVDSISRENIYFENYASIEAAKYKAIKDNLKVMHYKLKTRNIALTISAVANMALITVILLHYF